MRRANITKYITNIIQSFLENQTFTVKVGTTLLSERPIAAGVPQRSVLGPMLYNTYANDFPHNPSTEVADDIADAKAYN